MSYISISIMFISKIMQKIGNLKAKFPLSYAAAALIFIVALIPKGEVEIRFIQNTLYRYTTIGLIFIVSFLILVFANIKHKKKHKFSNMESDLINE